MERGEEVPAVRQRRRAAAGMGGNGGGMENLNEKVSGLFSKDEKGNVDWKQAASTASDLFSCCFESGQEC